MPIICGKLPDGFMQIMNEAGAAGKLSLAAGEWRLVEFGLLVVILGNLSDYLRYATTDQTFIQRYIAPKTLKEAKKTIILAGIFSVSIWAYFTLMGTALWTFYENIPDDKVATLSKLEIFPHFIANELPVSPAFGRGMHIDHILHDRWLCMRQNLTGHFSVFSHQEFVKKKVHQRHMPRVPDAFIIQVLNAPQIGFAHGAQPSRGRKCL